MELSKYFQVRITEFVFPLLFVIFAGYSSNVMGNGPTKLSDDIQSYLVDPPFDDIYDEDNLFQFNSDYLTLIRQSVLSWDGAERGAPRLDPLKPMGKADLFGQLSSIQSVGTSDQQRVRFYVSMVSALNYFTDKALLEPGEYELNNLSVKNIRELMRGYSYSDEAGLSDAELGFSDAGKVVMSAEIIALVKGAYWGWSNHWENDEMIGDGWWPSPAIDPKRPYGDMSYIELDMHRILEWPVKKRDKDGYIELTDEQQEQLTLLHFRLLAATQVFLENARLP